IGIKPSLIKKLGRQVVPSSSGTGTALANLNQRLIGLYGEESRLKIDSDDTGTTIQMCIPYH
ncbi:sensor protein LytS, partial [Lactiplantibacillus plantarum]|nr:sensor protein LytS [Lactiplantibacillus plantarum]